LENNNLKADLIIHPVRLQIMQTLASEPLNTQQIADKLPDIPKSSIYRHLKKLLDNKLIEISSTQTIKGIEEKTYRLAQAAHLGPDDIKGFSKDDHMRYFISYLATLMEGFSDYLKSVQSDNHDYIMDFMGYSELYFYASDQELMELPIKMQEIFAPLLLNQPAENRNKHKFAIVTHPIKARSDNKQEK
jgi:DNA-binding transcriptional ArsR family regulator